MSLRKLLRCLSIIFTVTALRGSVAENPSVPARAGSVLPDWTEGGLDIHFINTGRGETSFLILPDSTTLLVDAGAAPAEPNWSTPAKPNESRRPGEWIARYIERVIRPLPLHQIDAAVISHFHIDHMGAIDKNSPVSSLGGYQLGGLTEVAEHIPLRRLIDRNWPDYNWPVPLDDLKMRNYRQFVARQTAKNGLKVERFVPGRNDQIELVHNKARYPKFEIRNIAANGCVWTGRNTEAQNHFPANVIPAENKCSIALRIVYGKFDYFTGGDLDVSEVEYGSPGEEWKNIEEPVAKVTGAVEVMKANHHANFDANSVFLLRALRPQVVVASTWGQSQPSMNVYRRLLSKKTYPGPRELFFTNMMASTMSALHIDHLKNPTGHIVIRVKPGGDEFHVYVLDDTNENQTIKAVCGPFRSN
jgi:beta-lactamase superfamily II metal-dependent hydrolase